MVGFNTGIWSKLGFITLWFGAAATFWLVSVHRITAGCVFCFSLSVLLVPSDTNMEVPLQMFSLSRFKGNVICLHKTCPTRLGGWCGWLLGCYCVVAKVFRMLFNSKQFLEFCGWLLRCYCVVAKVFRIRAAWLITVNVHLLLSNGAPFTTQSRSSLTSYATSCS